MNKLIKSFLLVCSMCLICVSAAAGQAAQTESPAERRAKEFARLIDSGNRAELAKYAKENFAPNFLNIPMERHLGFFSGLHDSTRGVEFHSVQESKPNEATVLLKARLTGQWMALIVRIEAGSAAPNRRARAQRAEASGQRAAGQETDQRADRAESLKRSSSKLADADVFSGTVLLAKDGVPIFKGAYGVANKDFNAPNRIDTKFNLGSMNKMFTAVAIAQLVERGKLSFDDPLSKFLPDFPDKACGGKDQDQTSAHAHGGAGRLLQQAMERIVARVVSHGRRHDETGCG